jgi:hypothetical protein
MAPQAGGGRAIEDRGRGVVALLGAGLGLTGIGGATVGHSNPARAGYPVPSGGPAAERGSPSFGILNRAEVTFVENGLPDGRIWSVTLPNQTYEGTGGISIGLLNGTYPFQVGNVPGFTASPRSGNVTVDGTDVGLTINFTSNASPESATVLGLSPAVAYLVLGAGIGVAAIGLTFLVARRRRKGPQTEPP